MPGKRESVFFFPFIQNFVKKNFLSFSFVLSFCSTYNLNGTKLNYTFEREGSSALFPVVQGSLGEEEEHEAAVSLFVFFSL